MKAIIVPFSNVFRVNAFKYFNTKKMFVVCICIVEVIFLTWFIFVKRINVNFILIICTIRKFGVSRLATISSAKYKFFPTLSRYSFFVKVRLSTNKVVSTAVCFVWLSFCFNCFQDFLLLFQRLKIDTDRQTIRTMLAITPSHFMLYSASKSIINLLIVRG